MVIDPLYIAVNEGLRPLRITAAGQSDGNFLVRVSGAEFPSKMSRAWWFEAVELRFRNQEVAYAEIPATTRLYYWLVVKAFSNTGQGWSRLRRNAPTSGHDLAVPQDAVPYTSEAPTNVSSAPSPSSVIVSIDYC